eukprot:scaffold8253_cov163-Amphora_coffeaeformis.AAC.4
MDDADVVVFNGLWGKWKDWVYRPRPRGPRTRNDRFFACGAQIRFEDPQGGGDDTAANGLRLVFCEINNWNSQSTKTIYEGRWGSWKPAVMCKPGTYMNGAKVRFEGSQRWGDDTALNGLEITCAFPYMPKYELPFFYPARVYDGKWGDWQNWQGRLCTFVTAARVRFEDPCGGCDDTAWNGLELRFEDARAGETWCEQQHN